MGIERLRGLNDKVWYILRRLPETRDDDRLLSLEVWERFYGVSPWTPIQDVMKNKKLPSQESIGRCRRKIQEENEDMRGSKAAEDRRMEAQIDFLEYARGEER